MLALAGETRCLPSFAFATDGFLASFLDLREIFRVRAVNLYGVSDAVAEAVRQEGVVDDSVPALSCGAREVLVGGHPGFVRVTQVVSELFEMTPASKLLGAAAFGHLAREFREVTLLSCLDEDSLHAELLQFGRNGSAAFWIPLDARHVATLGASGYRFARDPAGPRLASALAPLVSR
jgi:hypothetical protein